jgi:predicted MFS family arabinose efflux permease
MTHSITFYAVTIFITQLIFIGCRTWNVKAISQNNILQTLLSGAIVHIAWLISISIGAISMNQIIADFKWEYTPIVFCSLVGGLMGSYAALKHKPYKL